MLKVTLEKHTLMELLGCLEELEICDETGQRMARLSPDPEYRQKMYDQAWASISEEEIEQARRQRGKGRTLAEVLKDLESRNGSLHGDLQSNGGSTARPDLADRPGP
jgi:CRISPR/Cas system-associated endonuclease Cas1